MSRHDKTPADCTEPGGPPSRPAPKTVGIDVTRVLLEFESSGRLMPWLGPAVRGIVAKRFRERHCILSPAEQAGRWRQCRGCPHLPSCLYGRTFEPDEQLLPVSATGRHGGGHDLPRMIVLSPAFPAPVRAERGLRLPLTVVAVGESARNATVELLEVLTAAGRAGVFGTDRLHFDVIGEKAARTQLRLDARALPDGESTSDETISRVRLVLTSPLFLRDRDDAGRPLPCRFPSFHRLVRAAVDTVAGMALVHAVPVASNTRAVVALARDVSTVSADWHFFDQEKHSNRTRMRFGVRGVTGEAMFADVPRAVLPWLTLAGLLHVGGHRVAGAGGWRLDFRQQDGHPA